MRALVMDLARRVNSAGVRARLTLFDMCGYLTARLLLDAVIQLPSNWRVRSMLRRDRGRIGGPAFVDSGVSNLEAKRKAAPKHHYLDSARFF